MNFYMKMSPDQLGLTDSNVHGRRGILTLFSTLPGRLRMLRGTARQIYAMTLHRRRLLGPFLFRFTSPF